MQNAETKAGSSTAKTIFHSSFFIRHSAFVLIALFALAVRLPQIGERPMHTDEAINAYITGELLAGESFHYDPQDRHGPALFAIAEPLAKLLGARNFPELTETQLRLSTVLTGTAAILLLGAGVELFGFIPCLVAALLIAFAPLPVYYSRYFIHENLFVTATLGLILSGCRAWQKKSLPSAALAGFCAALMLACKETAVIHFFALAVAAAVGWLWSARTSPRFETGRHVVPSESGVWPPHSRPAALIAIALFVFIFTVFLLFTWGGKSWSALADLLHAFPNFAARAGGQGHEKPFWYYARLLASGWSGTIILLLAAAGLLQAIRHPASRARFVMAVYALLGLAIYSVIPYKTPWLALNLWLPLAVLAGIGVEWLWHSFPKFSSRATTVIFVAAIGFLMIHDTVKWVFKFPADEKNPYAYAHTGEDLRRLPARLEELARQNKISHPRVAVVAADAWPLPWYLRKFSQVGFWQPDQETGAADFFITTTDVSGKLAERLKDFRPEFFGARPNVLLILWSPMTTNAAVELPASQP
jgi:uncharacterized protein (TIGR03663 family)